MNLRSIMEEAATLLASLDGINKAYGYPPETVSPPAAYVSYPQSVDYDATYGRGSDRITNLPISLVVGRVTVETTRDTAAAWASGSGEQSVKLLFEKHQWISCDDLTISSCTFDVETIAGIPYLVAVFTADIIGGGA